MGDEFMRLQQENFFASNLDNKKSLIQYCDNWLSQYEESYQIMDRICSSSKGNRHSFRLVSSIRAVNDSESYQFSLNLTRSSGEVMLEGPCISIDAKNVEVLTYLFASLFYHYLEKNRIEVEKDNFNGYLRKDKRQMFSDYRPASAIFDGRDIIDGVYSGNEMKYYLDTCLVHSYLLPEQVLENLRKSACKSSDVSSSPFSEEVQKNLDNYQKVLRFQ